MNWTVKGAASELNVSPALVYALCKSGRIRSERHGLTGRGAIRIPDGALAEYRERAGAGTPVVLAPAPPPLPALKHLNLQPAAPARGGKPATGRGAGSASRALTGRSGPQGPRP